MSTLGSTRAPRLIWLLIPLISLGGLGITLWQRAQVPSRQEWRTALDKARSMLTPRDKVAWLPEWANEGRLFMHDLNTLPLPFEGEVDLGRAERLFVLGTFGARGEDLMHPLSDLHARYRTLQPLNLTSTQEIGPITLQVLKVEGGEVLADLRADLEDPERVQVFRHRRPRNRRKVKSITPPAPHRCALWALAGWHCDHRDAPDATEACLSRPLPKMLKTRSKRRALYTLDRRRHLPYVDCGLHPTEHVSRDVRVIGEIARRCIWIAPHHRAQVELRWSIVPDLIQTTPVDLWLSAGWEDLAVDHPHRESAAQPIRITLSTLINGEDKRPLTDALKLTPTQGWTRWVWPLNEEKKARLTHFNGALSFQVSTPKDTRDASLCIDLTIRSRLPNILAP